MTNPTFFPELATPRAGDTKWRILQKILGATIDGSAGSPGTAGPFFGVGSPEGVVTGMQGSIYTTALGAVWHKPSAGVNNTGWVELIA